MNLSKKAGSTLGVTHSSEFLEKKIGSNNPIYYREKSKEFLFIQTRDKKGVKNPQ